MLYFNLVRINTFIDFYESNIYVNIFKPSVFLRSFTFLVDLIPGYTTCFVYYHKGLSPISSFMQLKKCRKEQSQGCDLVIWHLIAVRLWSFKQLQISLIAVIPHLHISVTNYHGMPCRMPRPRLHLPPLPPLLCPHSSDSATGRKWVTLSKQYLILTTCPGPRGDHALSQVPANRPHGF